MVVDGRNDNRSRDVVVDGRNDNRSRDAFDGFDFRRTIRRNFQRKE